MANDNQITLEAASDFSEVSADIFDKMKDAPGWKTSGSFNEDNIFDQMYDEVVTSYYAEATDVKAAGRQVLDLFNRWKPLAGQFARHALRGDVDDPLDANLNWDAEGAGQAIVRPLNMDSFTNAKYSQVPESEGQYNIVPDQTQGNGATATATENQQAFMVFGYADFYAGNKVSYDYIQEDINDDIGARRPFHVRNQMEGEDTLSVASRERGPLFVEPGFDLDIDVRVKEPGIETGLFPLGIEVVRADADEFDGVLDN
jgi:hypothetical protein